MKTKLILLIITTFFLTNSYSQEQCGTMKNLEEQIKKDPSIKKRMFQIEKQNQEWIEKNGRGFKKHSEVELNKNSNSTAKSSLNTNDLCGYSNTYFTTITAPSTINSIVSPSPNCTFGGEYVRVTNLVASNTYRISTIGTTNWDTQITIYPAGGGNAVAFNDDWNGSFQSEIYFTPFVTGNYDILINKYGCLPESLCASLEVELSVIPRPVITIPVVVHVIHYIGEAIGTYTNISDAQIQSQIDALNEDYRRINSEVYSLPAAFRGSSVDPLIQFCLAQQDPNGYPTTGIERFSINGFNEQSMAYIDANIKPVTIWDKDKYLNIWSCDIGLNPNGFQTLGYATFPSQSTPSNDGVVILYNVFGRVGNLTAGFNLGRTATHEIGHWLNLKHIWGNENACASDDDVIDTPLQTVSSSGCNVFPKLEDPIGGCSVRYPGIMFQNYMDYSNDNCLALFTYGQKDRIDATLFNQRASLLTSPGCLPGFYKVVISQIYGGGGNQNATYTNDYIELFNSGTVARNLNGWSVQYVPATAPTTGLTWFTIPLPNFTLQPGQYFLIKCAAGTTTSVALPQEDAVDTTITLSSTTGKVILVSNTTPETSVNPTGSQIIDKVGYGTTPNGYEGSGPTGTLLSNTTAAFRKLNGCTDTDSNPNDFSVGTPTPRNSSSQINNCNSSLSVSQNTIATVAVYPNPTHSKVFFDNANSNFKEVAVYNYLGQEVSKTAFNSISTNQEVDMSGLSAGVYILKFSNTERSQSIKVVKQ